MNRGIAHPTIRDWHQLSSEKMTSFCFHKGSAFQPAHLQEVVRNRWEMQRAQHFWKGHNVPRPMERMLYHFQQHGMHLQDSILSEFRNGIPLDDVIDELLRGEVLVEDFAPIRVFLWDGTDIDCEIEGRIDLTTHTYTCDNRRLFVFQQFADRSYDEVSIPVEWIDLADVDDDKLTTDCQGEAIRVRGPSIYR
ncbi:unnamed protein product [Effrenium voratum]|nr:unnamed protein product [Effrenium voratum]